MKEVYVSGRIGAESRTRTLVDELTARGYHVRVDWTGFNIRKPYSKYREENAAAARAMANAARSADVFILLLDPDMLGAHIETGLAIGGLLDDSAKRIFVVGEEIRESIFYTLPGVELVTSADDVLTHLPVEAAA